MDWDPNDPEDLFREIGQASASFQRSEMLQLAQLLNRAADLVDDRSLSESARGAANELSFAISQEGESDRGIDIPLTLVTIFESTLRLINQVLGLLEGQFESDSSNESQRKHFAQLVADKTPPG